MNNSDLIFITVIMRHIFSPWRQDGFADILVGSSSHSEQLPIFRWDCFYVGKAPGGRFYTWCSGTALAGGSLERAQVDMLLFGSYIISTHLHRVLIEKNYQGICMEG